MIYIFSIIFVLSILVFFHELGHFLFAKLFGVRVERFSIGFPPRLFGVKWGDTDYCVSAIPFGGYVKMAGVVDESMDTSQLTGAPFEFNSKKWWQKTLILIGGVSMNILLAWIILSSLLHIKGEPIVPSTTIGYITENGVSQKVGLQVGDEILKINQQPVSTWNEIVDLYLANLGREIIFTIKREGQVVDLVFDKKMIEQKNAEQLDIFPRFQAIVGDINPNSPAQAADLRIGDKIVRINDEAINNWDEMTNIIRRHGGKSLEFEIVRGDETLVKYITPETVSKIDESGVDHMVGQIGIGPYYDQKKLAAWPALVKGFNKTIFISQMSVKGLWWLLTGKKSVRESLGGPIMITKMAGDFAKIGFDYLMELIANLSIMLALINILPIPALDGGHILIVAIEEIRRKPLTVKTKIKIQQIGMAILFALIIFVMYNDITRIF